MWFRKKKPSDDVIIATVEEVITETIQKVMTEIRRQPFEVKHTVTHAPRPPAPVPQRIAIVYIMQDGTEWREYVPLNGQAYWEHPWPNYLNANQNGFPPVKIRFMLGYDN